MRHSELRYGLRTAHAEPSATHPDRPESDQRLADDHPRKAAKVHAASHSSSVIQRIGPWRGDHRSMAVVLTPGSPRDAQRRVETLP